MSFLSSTQIDYLTGTFDRHFAQFSTGINNYVHIYKEPIQVINNSSSVSLAGYGNDSLSNSDITYQEVSQTFPAMIINSKNLSSQSFTQLNFSIDKNDIFIKVKEDAKDYIINGKNERIDVNGQKYNNIVAFGVQNYFGSLYYYFKLNLTA